MYLAIVLILLILVCFGYLFLIKPNPKRESSILFTKHKYAHRGLFDNQNAVPENSLLAFQKARDAGFGVELDVQITADNKLVVFHDGSLQRMCGVDKTLSSLTYEELCKHTLLGTDERIPLFTDVLSLLGDTPIICEIKTYQANNDFTVCELVLDNIKRHPCMLCIESFNPLAVNYFRKKNPTLVRGQLSMNFSKESGGVSRFTGFLLKNLLLNFLTKPDFIAYRYADEKCFSFLICKKLFKPFTVAWTVKSKSDEEALRCFNSVIFEGYLPEQEISR